MEQPSDFALPPDLPRPSDDGAADHLKGIQMPQIALHSASGRTVDLTELSAPRIVVYAYPMTGVPGAPLPDGLDLIPGARGCTPHTCGFRNRHSELAQLKTNVFALSTQTTEYQREMTERLQLPLEILSDAEFRLCDALRLPTFQVAGRRLLRRLTFIVRKGRIEYVFYPVFPPNESAVHVLSWLRKHPVENCSLL